MDVTMIVVENEGGAVAVGDDGVGNEDAIEGEGVVVVDREKLEEEEAVAVELPNEADEVEGEEVDDDEETNEDSTALLLVAVLAIAELVPAAGVE